MDVIGKPFQWYHIHYNRPNRSGVKRVYTLKRFKSGVIRVPLKLHIDGLQNIQFNSEEVDNHRLIMLTVDSDGLADIVFNMLTETFSVCIGYHVDSYLTKF